MGACNDRFGADARYVDRSIKSDIIMRFKKVCFALLIVWSLIPFQVRAASGSGLPGSSQFGYGGRIDLWGDDPQRAITTAGSFNLDWVAVDFDWARLQPESDLSIQWASLDQTIQNAVLGNLGVMISITNAPRWAMAEDGPNPQRTADLAAQLARRYPDVFLALELFPSANTVQGWGTKPDVQAYAEMLKATSRAIQSINPEIALVAAGLNPQTSSNQDISDAAFLSRLYRIGAAEFMPILGVRLPSLGNNPLATVHETDDLVLRHYEEIRNIMVDNGHKSGLIWITGFSWDRNSLRSPSEQAAWVKQAYLLFRAQLYIGAAFFDGLNVSPKASSQPLILNGNLHPGFEELVQIIAQDNNSQTVEIYIDLYKQLTRKNIFKGS